MIEYLSTAWHFISHLDQELGLLFAAYGKWFYGILFAIVFCETGLVVTPFLPGDSLLFAAGTLCASAGLDPLILSATLIAAALCGDNCNYWIGRFLATRVERVKDSRFINKRALERTEAFYGRHGGKTIVMARFVPLVRTFAPFVAGVGAMPYPRFIGFSIFGAVLWVGSLVSAGYFFGTLPVVRDNFALVIAAIVVISLLPIAIEYLKSRRRSS